MHHVLKTMCESSHGPHAVMGNEDHTPLLFTAERPASVVAELGNIFAHKARPKPQNKTLPREGCLKGMTDHGAEPLEEQEAPVHAAVLPPHDGDGGTQLGRLPRFVNTDGGRGVLRAS